MTTAQLVILDLGIGAGTAAAWLAAGAVAATRRPRAALALLVTATVLTLARVGSVIALAGSGWWFVQEKVLLGLPLLGVAAVPAAVVVAPGLIRAAARGPGRDAAVSPVAVVLLFAAGYAGLAGVAVTFGVGYPLTWSVALIAVSLVTAAVLLTWRLVEPAAGSPV